MDWAELEGFLKLKLGHAPATVLGRRRSRAYMVANGMDWDAFATTPQEALRRGDDWLAWKMSAGGSPASIELYKRVLNDAAAFCRHKGGAEWRDVRWKLQKIQLPMPDPYSDQEMWAILGYEHRSALKTVRRRALSFMCIETALRRGEQHPMKWPDDFDQQRAAVAVRDPRKRGPPRWIPISERVWDPDSPMMRWLAYRENYPGEYVWCDMRGAHLTYHGLAGEFDDMSRELGFTVSFNRFRRTQTVCFDTLKIPLPNVGYLRGHSRVTSTLWYANQSLAKARNAMAEAGLPGHRREEVIPPSWKRAWGLDGTPVSALAWNEARAGMGQGTP